MFRFSIFKAPFHFSDVGIAIPATCLVIDLRPLRTIQAIFVCKERFDATSVQKNNI